MKHSKSGKSLVPCLKFNNDLGFIHCRSISQTSVTNVSELGSIYEVMHQIAMGNRSAIGAFLYPLPTELEVEISHNSAFIHVVQYLCISFVRHGKWCVKISTYRLTINNRYLIHNFVGPYVSVSYHHLTFYMRDYILIFSGGFMFK